MNRKNIEEVIRENWFKNHKATLTQHGDLQVLEWAEPGTRSYYVRYVFDGRRMYITGDIGEAVFYLTWKAEVHSFENINIDYFMEKLEAYHSNRMDFDSKEAAKELKEWVEQLCEDEDEAPYDTEKMEELIEAAESCSSKEEWAHEYVNGSFYDFIYELDNDYWDWIYDIGDKIPNRIYGYLEGLKMASEQLKNAN